jgi:glycosyltransferase involved in cell wall biosynthesis
MARVVCRAVFAMIPKVSVIIPVRNRPAAVHRAIESVLRQTFGQFEVMVVDDGSTDDTVRAVQAWSDPRLKLICHGQNRGGSAARNTGIRASSAPYIAFLDSDDEWLPTKLERQLELFERSDDGLALVYTGAQWVYPNGSFHTVTGRHYRDLTRKLLIENVIGETSVGMVRRSALDNVGVFDETLPSCQDMDLWLRLSERFRADVIAEPLARITKGDDGGRISNNLAHAAQGRALFCQKHRNMFIQHGVLHVYLRNSGWWQHRRMRDSHAARHLYLDSLAVNPFAVATYGLLAVTFLPNHCLDVMAKCKRLVDACPVRM